MSGLPPDAAIHRDDTFTRVEELLALLAERTDAWARVQWGIAARSWVEKPSSELGFETPDGVVAIRRPGELPEPSADGSNRIVTDTAEIAAFFGKP